MQKVPEQKRHLKLVKVVKGGETTHERVGVEMLSKVSRFEAVGFALLIESLAATLLHRRKSDGGMAA